jgi:ribonuclease P protein component
MARLAQAAASRCHNRAGNTWRSLKSVDFAVVLTAPIKGKTQHFVLHHAASSPGIAESPPERHLVLNLSTDDAPIGTPHVDNLSAPVHWWLGLVVPKRHARRAVTRNLLKREMRMQADEHRERLPPGQWVIRLRAPFDPRRFPSAASSPLCKAARRELELVFAGAVTA